MSKKITMADMAEYYGTVLKNGRDLSERDRRYLSELRDQAAAGTEALASHHHQRQTGSDHG